MRAQQCSKCVWKSTWTVSFSTSPTKAVSFNSRLRTLHIHYASYRGCDLRRTQSSKWDTAYIVSVSLPLANTTVVYDCDVRITTMTSLQLAATDIQFCHSFYINIQLFQTMKSVRVKSRLHPEGSDMEIHYPYSTGVLPAPVIGILGRWKNSSTCHSHSDVRVNAVADSQTLIFSSAFCLIIGESWQPGHWDLTCWQVIIAVGNVTLDLDIFGVLLR